MASDLPFAWLRQAQSDLHSAERGFANENPCQLIARYQQVVEKSAKAIADALFDRAVLPNQIRVGHDVDRLVSAVISPPRRRANRSIQLQIAGLLNESRRGEIKAICQLAPRRAAPGQLESRNTEYPYQNADGTWRAPADPGSFSGADADRFRRLARSMFDGALKLVSALYRTKPVR